MFKTVWNKIKSYTNSINLGFNNIDLSVDTTNDKTAFLTINNNPMAVLVDENGNLQSEAESAIYDDVDRFYKKLFD